MKSINIVLDKILFVAILNLLFFYTKYHISTQSSIWRYVGFSLLSQYSGTFLEPRLFFTYTVLRTNPELVPFFIFTIKAAILKLKMAA